MIKSKEVLIKKIIKEAKKTDPNDYLRKYPPLFLQKDRITSSSLRLWQDKFFSQKNDRRGSFGVYVNIPFCKQRCFFCKYPTQVDQKKVTFDKYLDYLQNEIDYYNWPATKFIIDSLYVGGGTPTILSANQLKLLFDLILSHFKLGKDAQFLIEATPESLSSGKIKILKDNRVTRLTIGGQSLSDLVLKKINRGHTYEVLKNSFRVAREGGIKNIHLDLIMGLPFEEEYSWPQALNRLDELSPDSVSLYKFYLSPDTYFHQKKEKIS